MVGDVIIGDACWAPLDLLQVTANNLIAPRLGLENTIFLQCALLSLEG